MQAPSEDVKDMLEAKSGLGLTFASDLFIGFEPASPDNCVTIFDTPGFPKMITLGNDVEFDKPCIQIRVRNRSYLAGYDLIQEIVNALHGRGPETWNGTVYCSITCVGDPALLGWDSTGRTAQFVANFNIIRR